MVRLNKNRLAPHQTKQLFEQLTKVLSSANSGDFNTFLSELLGEEEQIMIAKRLAVIILLSEGLSAYKIADKLKLSQSTIATIGTRLMEGKYPTIEKSLKINKKQYFNLLEVVDRILHLNGTLPHYNGYERYRSLKI